MACTTCRQVRRASRAVSAAVADGGACCSFVCCCRLPPSPTSGWLWLPLLCRHAADRPVAEGQHTRHPPLLQRSCGRARDCGSCACAAGKQKAGNPVLHLCGRSAALLLRPLQQSSLPSRLTPLSLFGVLSNTCRCGRYKAAAPALSTSTQPMPVSAGAVQPARHVCCALQTADSARLSSAFTLFVTLGCLSASYPARSASHPEGRASNHQRRTLL